MKIYKLPNLIITCSSIKFDNVHLLFDKVSRSGIFLNINLIKNITLQMNTIKYINCNENNIAEINLTEIKRDIQNFIN